VDRAQTLIAKPFWAHWQSVVKEDACKLSMLISQFDLTPQKVGMDWLCFEGKQYDLPETVKQPPDVH
jgi:hypothetical protein